MTSTVRSEDGRVIVPSRLRQRRVEVRRGQGRRRLRRLVALGALLGVVAVGWILLRSPFLAVHEVTVTGTGHLTLGQVETTAGIHKGVAMMDVSTGAAQRRLEASPWVARAEVTRHWPDEVAVHLVDRRPAAQVAAGSTFALVDDSGRVLEQRASRWPGFPRLLGVAPRSPGEHISNAGPLLAAARQVPTDLRNVVEGIGYVRSGVLMLETRDGGRILLGTADGLDVKIGAVKTMLDHLGGLEKGCTLDVTVPATPVVSPARRCGSGQ